MRILERLISLQVIDNKWREHLLAMDHLRDGIWAMGYGERNPLVEYKIEGSRIFSDMLINLKEEIMEYMMKVEIRRIEEEVPAHPRMSPAAMSRAGQATRAWAATASRGPPAARA